MPIIKPLPSWALVNRFPSFYDGESLTAIEQTARLYGKVNELIETYNHFVTENNAELTELEGHIHKDLGCAIRTIINLTDSYITQVELRMTHQDRKLDDAYKSFTTDIVSTVDSLIRQMKEAGELDQVILDAIDNLNVKFDNYTANVSEEQAALKADYEAAKAALNVEYTECMDNINAYFGEMQNELRTDIQLNAAFRSMTGHTLYTADIVDGVVPNLVGQNIPNLSKYSIVGVLMVNRSYAICKVHKLETGNYALAGVGAAGVPNNVNSDTPLLRLSYAHIIINAGDDVTDCRAGVYSLSSMELPSTGIIGNVAFMDVAALGITRIDGLVLNGGNIS